MSWFKGIKEQSIRRVEAIISRQAYQSLRRIQGRKTTAPRVVSGLTVGQSTQADILMVLGKPKAFELLEQAKSTNKRIIWNKYEGVGEYPGEFIVELDESRGVLVGMFQRLSSEQYISRENAIKHFGKDHVKTRYDLDECAKADDGENARLYESPNGPFLYLEYRSRGIALYIDGEDNLRRIIYLGQNDRLGSISSLCKK